MQKTTFRLYYIYKYIHKYITYNSNSKRKRASHTENGWLAAVLPAQTFG